MEITGMNTTSLLPEKDPRTIERQIIDFINKMKGEGSCMSQWECNLAHLRENDW